MTNSGTDLTSELLCLKALGIRELYVDSIHSEAVNPEDRLRTIADDVTVCTRCRLSRNRIHAVPGEGNPAAELMFVGEGPGGDEDRQGRPFVGAAGELLEKIIQAMTLQREDVFISNIVKCRPPSNRNPQEDECAACIPYLREQIQVIQPRVIVTLGAVAACVLLDTDQGISSVRGMLWDLNGIKVMPTYHPAYLLRTPSAKKDVWSDMKQVMSILGLS